MSLAANLKDAWNAIEEMGGEIPPNKNFANLAAAIETISVKPPYDPNNPTLEGLKAAMQAGDYEAFPVGTEIPDTYNGNSNPLIVAQYLNSSNNSAYGGAKGVILVRKYVEPTSQMFGSSVDYSTSTIKNFLGTTYYNNCSDSLKSVISDITIPYDGSTIQNQKWFLMSDIEVCSNRTSTAEGIMFEYWEQKTGLSSPSWEANNGRIMKDRNGNAQNVCLRSRYGISSVSFCCVNIYGAVIGVDPKGSYGVLPACSIGKD